MKGLHFGLRLVLGWMLILGGLGVQMPQPAAAQAAEPPVPAGAGLLQFQAGEHLMGFAADRVYWVAVDHALSTTFLGTPGVTPQSAGSAGSRKGAAAPLEPVTYRELWPGVELVYTAADGGIAKATYTVAPGADPGQIRLRYNVPVAVQGDGSLAFAWERGRMTESAPVAWQTIAGRRVPVAVAFAVREGQEVGFTVGAYDPRYPLVIDPIYGWHTFYSTYTLAVSRLPYDISLDSAGNLYVVAVSADTWLGDGGAVPLHPHSRSSADCIDIDVCTDIAVVKLNSAGSYQWHTFYGAANQYDLGSGVIVDDAGNVYVAGQSGALWLGYGGAEPLHFPNGNRNLLVLKLNADGVYQWHTFYPDSEAYDLELDSVGNVYITGYSDAGWLGDNDTPSLHPHSEGDGNPSDLLVLKLNSAGAYQWHTFYGAGEQGPYGSFSYARDIEIDGDGNLYLVGLSSKRWLGDNGTPPLHSSDGDWSLFVLKLNTAGAYQWHTFYRFSDDFDSIGRRSCALALDGAGNVFVAGLSNAEILGDPGGAPLHEAGDLLIMKLNPDGAYQWHTFYWGQASDLVADAAGDLYLLGSDHSYSGPEDHWWAGEESVDPWHPLRSRSENILIMKLSHDGIYRWHTFYGGLSSVGDALALGADGALYGVGGEDGLLGWLGDDNAEPIHPYEDNYYSAFSVLKLGDAPVSTTYLKSSANPALPGEPVTFTARVATEAGQPTGTLTFTIAGHSEVTRTLDARGVATYSVTGFVPGTYTVTVRYGGNGLVLSHPGTLVEEVKLNAAVQLVASPASPMLGQPLVVTATVLPLEPGAGVPTGRIAFRFDSNERPASGWRALNASGVAVYSHSFWTTGLVTITATYDGDAYYFGGAAAVLTQAVQPAGTEFKLYRSAASTNYGDPVGFRARVRLSASGEDVPTGTVFFNGPDGEVPVALKWGWAVYTTTLLTVGVNTVTARFDPGTLYLESTAMITHPVIPAPTISELRGEGGPVVYGQPATYTATVRSKNPGIGDPSGTVTFTVTGQAPAVRPIGENGVAVWTTDSRYPAATYTVMAEYGGSGNFSGSRAAGSLTVSPAQTRVQLDAAPGAVHIGQPTVLTATVSVVAPGSGVPTGVMTWTLTGQAPITKALDSSGVMSHTVIPTSDTTTVTVEYGGDGHFLGSKANRVQTVTAYRVYLPLIVKSLVLNNR